MNNKAIEAAIAGWFESNDGAYTKDPEFHARMQKAISAYHAALVEDEAMEAAASGLFVRDWPGHRWENAPRDERLMYIDRARAAIAPLLAHSSAGRDAERYRLEIERLAAINERLVKTLTSIHMLIPPDPLEVNGVLYSFRPNDHELVLDAWHALGKAIREIPEAIDKARGGEHG